ncbi:MAG: 50S ribosomal protein L25/general stress protein Ctc [Coxiellaceae bacterium]|nr:50S ribosomal protein L25/general stress protein Ctc [Coxiellaceae bacterium]
MSKTFTIDAVLRCGIGRGMSRRLRRTNKVPAIVYGDNKPPTAISIDDKSLLQLLEHESFCRILNLNLDGVKEQVVLKNLQRHPFKPKILHLDLQRTSATKKLTIRIPLHFVGGDVAPGVKIAGGLISRLMSDVEIRCLPQNLPELIEVDLSNLELNQTIHLSDLNLPKDVEIVALSHNENKPIATAYIPRVVVEEETSPTVAEVPTINEEKVEGASMETETKKDNVN